MAEEQFLAPARGTRDFLPAEALLREKTAETLKKTFRKYGFLPLETPVLEKYEVLSSKFAGGEEILNETYRLKDQGDRELGLRYDLTVPLCRVFAANSSLAKPFKRYQIAPVYRDGPLKAGRYREFVQCDVDCIGPAGMAADAEILALTDEAFKALGVDAVVKFNNRKLLNGLLEYAGIAEEKRVPAILSVDKLEKVGEEKVLEEMVKERKVSEKAAKKLLKALNEAAKLGGNDLLGFLDKTVESSEGREGLSELKELFSLLENYGVGSAELDVRLARGLNYYTGTVFEAFQREGAIKSSLAGGGRYDNLIGAFAGSAEKIPAVGISFGLDVIMEVLKEKQAGAESGVKVFVIPIGGRKTLSKAIETAQKLRGQNVSAAMDLMERNVSKNMDYASKQGFPFVILVGEQEIKANKVKLKDMKTGQEELVFLDEAVRRLS